MSEGHHMISPSAYARWSKCPGAPRAEAGLTDSSTPEQQEGTMLHAFVAEILTKELQENKKCQNKS